MAIHKMLTLNWIQVSWHKTQLWPVLSVAMNE
jgi:hypothetical protein